MKETSACTTNHRNKFVNCVEKVVYVIPLTCGKKYVDQTGRCINERMRERYNNVHKSMQGYLGLHCPDCGCQPDFRKTMVTARHNNQMMGEIIEASKIIRLEDDCVSMASLAVTQKGTMHLNP